MDELLPMELTLLLPGLGGKAAPHIKSSCQQLRGSSNQSCLTVRFFHCCFILCPCKTIWQNISLYNFVVMFMCDERLSIVRYSFKLKYLLTRIEILEGIPECRHSCVCIKVLIMMHFTPLNY